MRVKPAEGRAVRDPLTKQLLPAVGREVPDNQFWRRRLRDGDVIAATNGTPVERARASADMARNGPPTPRREA